MRRFRPIRSQFLWTYVITWTLLGNVVAYFFMSGGPTFYERITGSDRFTVLTSYLSQQAPMTNEIRDWLWTNYASGLAGSATGISAFPSLHLALATLFVIQAWHFDRRLGFVLGAFCAVIQIGSVHLGWHYAIDGYFSIIATMLIWKATGWVLARGPNEARANNPSLSAAYRLRES